VFSHGSGDFALAFSTANKVSDSDTSESSEQRYISDDSPYLGLLFRACVEAVEESVLNSLFMAETMVGRDGHTRFGLPIDTVLEILARHQVID
jgi:D-aminopeptidase